VTAERTGIAALVQGARIHWEGLRLLGRERRLWALALVPLLASVVLAGATLAGIAAYAGEIHAFVTAWMPAPEASSVWSWLWVGPARAGLALLGVLLFAIAAGAALVVAFLLASVLAAPFLDALSRRVEGVLLGRVHEEGGGGLGAVVRESGRAVWEEAKRTLAFLGAQLGIALVGLVVPGAQLVAAPAAVLLTMLFLPLDYASFALDRRRVRFREKRRWMRERTSLLLGYGGAAFALCLVPGLNFLAMPVLVASGTLLALRHGPATEAGADTAAVQSSSAR
jgi:uncharacterized protein involved in cysteine biosynthesis